MATAHKSTKSERIGDLLAQGREMSARIILFHQTLAARFGLNATDHKCLDLARNEPEITAGRLAEVTGLTTGAITAALDRLERAGFVCRERHPTDRRKVVIRALPAAHEKLAPDFAVFGRAMAAIHQDYTVAELDLLHGYQKRVLRVLQEQTERLRHASPTS